MSEYPEFIARFYDTIYDSVRSHVDDEFFEKMILNSPGPVLEVGTGSGRIFYKARQNGADIYGIDISPEMLNILKKKLPRDEHNRVSIQNIVDFKFEHKFTLIIAPFRVFMHLLTVDDQLQALNNVYNHLAPGGKFIFDLYIPDLSILQNGLTDVVDFEGEYKPGLKLKRTSSSQSDPITQINNVTMVLEWDKEKGGKESKKWQFPMRFFFYHELQHLLHRSTFKRWHIYGDYLLNKLNNASRDYVVICDKT